MADKKISQLSAATTPLAGTEVLPIVQSGSTVKVSVANLTAGRSTSVGFLDVAATAGKVGNLNTTDANGLYLTGQTNGASRWDFGSAKQVFNAGTEADFGLGTRGGYLALGVNAEHLKIASGGNATVTTGNVVVGTAGKGIDFSANTHAAGMTSELLNWYETGTWTPTLTCSDGNFDSVTYDPLRGGRYTRVGNMVHVQCYMRTDAVDNTVGRSGDVLIAGLPFAAVTATSGTLDGHSSLAVSVASAWTGEEPLAAFISGGDTNIQLLYRSAVDGNTANVVAADVNTGANANIVLIAGTYICA